MNKKNLQLAIKMSALVGTALAIINHYDMFISGKYEFERIVKIIITYIVPFSVSLYSSTFANKSKSS